MSHRRKREMRENVWKTYTEENLKDLFQFCEGYKDYISKCKTERECVKETIRIVEAQGYHNIQDYIANQSPLKAGDKIYANNYDKTIALFVIGQQPMENGMKILGAHIDSPRIDLKQNPVYEDTDLALLDTHYYGGIKKFHWVALPLAMHGVVCKKDGTTIDVVLGEDENDPVVAISDLLVHLSGEQMSKPASKVIEGESLEAFR